MRSKNFGQSRVNDNWHPRPALYLLLQTENICQTLMYQWLFNFQFILAVRLPELLLFWLLWDIIDSRVIKDNSKFPAWIVERFGDKCGTLSKSQCWGWPACVVFARCFIDQGYSEVCSERGIFILGLEYWEFVDLARRQRKSVLVCVWFLCSILGAAIGVCIVDLSPLSRGFL